MADWFKVYEDFLKDPKFHYGLGKVPQLTTITIMLLCEHCRLKSDTIPWGDEIDLFGYSSITHQTPEQIKEAIAMLQTLKFIEIGEHGLKFLNWNASQSDYCRKLNKSVEVHKSPEILNQVKPDKHSSPENIAFSPEMNGNSGTEEIRVEERIGDKKEKMGTGLPLPLATTPELLIEMWCLEHQATKQEPYTRNKFDLRAAKDLLKTSVPAVDIIRTVKDAWLIPVNLKKSYYHCIEFTASLASFYSKFPEIQNEIKRLKSGIGKLSPGRDFKTSEF